MKTIAILDFLLLFASAAQFGHAIASDEPFFALTFALVFVLFSVLLVRDVKRAWQP